ncbi:hypothetical protein GIB67_010671 [Kingdonia uniflora]|uniref:Uncharacterized protein n=1 Tax=Kingdonia uniflora TaxID=39325 RepID=A0A7J7LT60_9MAGN|nr:hypothetical protein GIB67_010671 [Kingdonia uniflora]
MLKAPPASGTTGSGEVAKDKRRRVEPSGESGEKIAEGRFSLVDDLKEVEEMARLAVLQGEEDMSKMVARLVKGIWLGIEEEKSELKKVNVELEKELARSRDDTLKEVKLGRHLMLKDYSEEEAYAIKANTYFEEEDEEEAEAVGIMDCLDGVSRQIVLDNQGDDVELSEGGSEKIVRKISLKIYDLESGVARQRETSKALLSVQAELPLQSQVEEIYSEIKNGLKELTEVTKHAKKLQCQVDAFAVKGKQANMAQYRIKAQEQSEKRF